ncbi:MAG: peptidylprolyl isomerase, partial [Bdellovibrio sp.]
QEILAEIRGSKRPFKELVKLYSDDPISKAQDGDAGWHRRSGLPPGYYDQLLKLKTGEISELLETPNGFHIVQLIDRRSFDAASIAMTRVEWYEEQKVKIGRQFTDQVRARFKVQINQDLLK